MEDIDDINRIINAMFRNLTPINSVAVAPQQIQQQAQAQPEIKKVPIVKCVICGQRAVVIDLKTNEGLCAYHYQNNEECYRRKGQHGKYLVIKDNDVRIIE